MLKLNHIGLFTNEPYILINFYRRYFGFKRVKEEIIPEKMSKKIFGVQNKFLFVKLENDEAIIEIFQNLEKKFKKRARAVGFNHIGLVTKNTHKIIKKLKIAKIKILSVYRNRHKIYFVLDPDNNLIEIKEQKNG